MTSSPPPVLADGSAPMTPRALLDRIEQMGIRVTTVRHEAVFTVAEARALRGDLPGAHTKNLFVRDKKGSMSLVVALADRAIDMRALAEKIGSKRLSFGSPGRLMKFLGVIPGAVNPFCVVNDPAGVVSLVLDRGLREYDLWNFHPLDNAMTTTIRAEDMLRFLEAEGHVPRWVDL